MKHRTTYFYVFLVIIIGIAIGYFTYHQKMSSEQDILTTEERAWLNARPIVRLAPDPNFPPIEFYNEQGVYSGMMADYFRLIENKLHYRFEIVRLATWGEVLQQAKDRQIDGITAAQITPERQEYLLYTQPVIDIPNVIIVRDDIPGDLRLEDMAGMTVAITRGNAIQEYLQTQYPDVIIIPVDDDLLALLEVSFYRADATLVNMAIASYYIENQGISNLRVAGDSGKTNPLAIASRSDEPMLNSILGKGLSALAENEKAQVYSRWVNLNGPADVLNEDLQTGIFAGLAVVVLLLSVLALWNIMLRRRVVSRTRDLQEELASRQQAEEALKQQNLFLDALNQTTLALVNRLDIDELLQRIIDQAMVLFDVPQAFIYSLDETGAEPELEVRVMSEAYRHYVGFRIRVGEGLSGRVWQSGEPLIVDDYALWEGRTGKLDRDRSFHAMLGYPLKSEGRVIGVLGLSHTDPLRRFTEHHTRLVERFASLAVIAMDNANLYKTLTHELAVRQQAELRYRQLVEHINAITYLDANDEFSSNLYTSPQIEQMLGYSVEEWLSDPEMWVKQLHPEDRERIMALNERCRLSGESFNTEYRLHTRDGGVIWVHDDAVLIQLVDEDRQVWHGIMYDITERKQTEEALRMAEKRFRDLIERFHAVFYVEDVRLESIFLYISPQVESLLGYTVAEWLADATLWLRIVHPEDRERVAAMNTHVFTTGEDFRMEYRMVAKDGRVVWIYDESALTLDMAGNPENWQGVWIDITERKRSEEMLLTSQKMADLGTLAAGVAHELNSPLQIITGASEVLLSRLEKNETLDVELLKRRLEMINKSAWRSAGIIRSLLNYARSTSEEMDYYNLNALIEEALNLIGHQLKTWSNITISTDLAPDLPDLWCDRNQILQVLINLMINARDAMPRGGGGITLNTRHSPQSHVIILKVSDTGVGIPQDVIRNIFDPFFTTKPLGQGTGLGLSIVMGFVNAHNGGIDVESQPGQGTTFTLYFPEEPSAEEGEAGKPPKAGRFHGEV